MAQFLTYPFLVDPEYIPRSPIFDPFTGRCESSPPPRSPVYIEEEELPPARSPTSPITFCPSPAPPLIINLSEVKVPITQRIKPRPAPTLPAVSVSALLPEETHTICHIDPSAKAQSVHLYLGDKKKESPVRSTHYFSAASKTNTNTNTNTNNINYQQHLIYQQHKQLQLLEHCVKNNYNSKIIQSLANVTSSIGNQLITNHKINKRQNKKDSPSRKRFLEKRL